jgi:hypothetical protein
MGTWSPPTSSWRRHAPWIVPAVLLVVIVAVLGFVWHAQTSPPAFQNQELQIPAALKQNDAANAAPTGPGERAPNG